MKNISALLEQTFNYYQNIKDNDYVISPAIPILYFGEINYYFKSPIKIITVGKNPSPQEFRQHKNQPYSFVRFPTWEKQQDYPTALNYYFEYHPYKSWFESYEVILNQIQASYYSKTNQINRALHADICSPIATYPTWSKLSKKAQQELFNPGFKLWQDIIDILQPDILLISIAKSWLQELKLLNQINFKTFEHKSNGIKRKQAYTVYQYEYLLGNGKVSQVYFGQAAEKPFGSLSNNFKRALGQEILGKYR